MGSGVLRVNPALPKPGQALALFFSSFVTFIQVWKGSVGVIFSRSSRTMGVVCFIDIKYLPVLVIWECVVC